MSLDDVLAHLAGSTETDLADLTELVAFESIASDPTRRGQVEAAAAWIAAYAERIGLRATLHPTGGGPVVVAETVDPDPAAPTVLVYAHYDVQPAGSADAWSSPPFVATRRDARVYGRGASDDKGQLLMHLGVVRSFLASGERLPVNLRFVFEGDEEIASPYFDAFLAAEAASLQADVAVVTDGSMFRAGTPSVGYGVRGLVYLEVTVRTLDHDLHSGIFGGAVPNAAAVLARAIATLHDDDGRITVDGFLDAVRPIEPDERARLAALPVDGGGFLAGGGARFDAGDPDFSVLERLWLRPTLEVNGLASGDVGEGMKTIVPASATARISARLVPDQEPGTVAAAIEAHLRRVLPAGTELTVTTRNQARPAVVAADHPAVDAAIASLTEAYGQPAVRQRHGGSIPPVAGISRELGIPTMMIGFGLPEANAHAPDEWLSIQSFERGREAIARLWDRLGNLGRLDPISGPARPPGRAAPADPRA